MTKFNFTSKSHMVEFRSGYVVTHLFDPVFLANFSTLSLYNMHDLNEDHVYHSIDVENNNIFRCIVFMGKACFDRHTSLDYLE